jgi:hypothetical protein
VIVLNKSGVDTIDYLPAEVVIRIDIRDPGCIEQVRQAVLRDAWQRNLEAIAYARQLILNRYQFFPFIVCEIRGFEAQPDHIIDNMPQEIFLSRNIQVPIDKHEALRRIWFMITSVCLRSKIARIRYLFER